MWRTASLKYAPWYYDGDDSCAGGVSIVTIDYVFHKLNVGYDNLLTEKEAWDATHLADINPLTPNNMSCQFVSKYVTQML